jgi:hypothetical protein
MDDGRMRGTSHNRTIWRTRRTTNKLSGFECRQVYICGLEAIDLRVFEVAGVHEDRESYHEEVRNLALLDRKTVERIPTT